MPINDLHIKLNEIIEYADNDQFFGFPDDPISKQYKPSDNVPPTIKNLFIANVMNKFTMLFTNL